MQIIKTYDMRSVRWIIQWNLVLLEVIVFIYRPFYDLAFLDLDVAWLKVIIIDLDFDIGTVLL